MSSQEPPTSSPGCGSSFRTGRAGRPHAMEIWKGRERRGCGEPQGRVNDGVGFSEVSWGPGYLQGIDMVRHFCMTLDGDIVTAQSSVPSV